MQLLDIIDELGVDGPAASPASAARLLAIGRYLGVEAAHRVIDFGCGRGEMLCLWARCFGARGVGVDRDEGLLADARARAQRWHVESHISFLRQEAKEFRAQERFDVAACIGATMCFGGFDATLGRLREFVGEAGSLVVAEPYFTTREVPRELREYEGDELTEPELFDIARSHGLEVGYYSRATEDEWDRYIFSSRKREMVEFQALPPGPAREERRKQLHRWQDMYLDYRQKWQRMAFLTLHPV
jgi:cyclopropane fatty-acyl-phospholipid synthase-like methyltransferase